MNVKEILKGWLIENGFEGLRCESCGCEVDDLMPCDSCPDDCEPGYKIPCDPKACPLDGDCAWHISTVKPDGKDITAKPIAGYSNITIMKGDNLLPNQIVILCGVAVIEQVIKEYEKDK